MAEEGDDDVQEYLYKILVVGELGCGKTSIIHRYVSNVFSNKYRATVPLFSIHLQIGVDFALKVINWDEHTNVRLQLWDIAGQERFGHMTRVYYKEAVGAFVVYDVTRAGTFDAVKKWKDDIDDNLNTDSYNLPVVLLANKCDLVDEGQLNPAKMDEYCAENHFIGWFVSFLTTRFKTSAKDDIGINDAANRLVAEILKLDPEVSKTQGTVPLGPSAGKTEKKSGCC